MVRVLHTGDWHIGQTLRGYSREFEHAHVLAQLSNIVAEREIDVLIVAGDIFDSQNPSGESQSLFYETLERLHRARPEMSTVIVAGNHDAAGRLEAPHPLLARFKVHVVGSIRRRDGRILTDRHHLALADSSGEVFLHVLAVSYPTATFVDKQRIDEGGFGSLDRETLDTAVDALERLHSSGRKVGVITHVAAIVERIAVQVRVEKLGGGLSQVSLQ